MPGTAVCTLSIGNSRPQWELLAPGERAIQFSRSGRFLLTSAKNRIRLRDTRDWSVAEEISHRGAGVSRAEFSPDGRHLAYATYSPNVVRIATLSNVDTVDPGSRGQIQEKH
jgi:WD40 repeat protein